MCAMRGTILIPQGLVYKPDFITQHEELELLKWLEPMDFEKVIMHDQEAKRVVKHFGLKYNYTGGKLTTTEEFPEEFAWLRERASLFSHLDPKELEECLVTKYPPGSVIGWHRDAPMFGSKIIGVSLGSSCQMQFQYTKDEKRYVYEKTLQPRSIYLISGVARYQWQHRITPTPGVRYSLTFRTLREPT